VSRPRRHWRSAFLILAFGLSAGIVWYFTRSGTPPPMPAGHNHGAASSSGANTVMLSEAESRRIGVTFAVATLSPLEREIRTVAQVTYDETRVASFATKVDGWVEQLYVNATGQAVRKGDALLELYSPMIVAAEQDLVLAHRLAGDLSQATEDAVGGARDLVASARRRLAYWDVSPEEIERVERTGQAARTVRFASPVSGVVLEKPVLRGQRIMAGDPVYRIADLSTVWIEGEVFERDLSAVKVGQRVMAEFQALPGDQRRGTISYISPTLDPDTRTATVRVVLPNPRLELKPGMYTTLEFTSSADPVLTIPRSAVLVTGARALAFIKRGDGAFEPRELALGAASDDRVEVLRGLTVGDSVVASATFLVDAESNLGTIMGGMGNMPGMDIRPADSMASHQEK
jgi:Cu(I)/Ag(I) efflux system membrane fusion protein